MEEGGWGEDDLQRGRKIEDRTRRSAENFDFLPVLRSNHDDEVGEDEEEGDEEEDEEPEGGGGGG